MRAAFIDHVAIPNTDTEQAGPLDPKKKGRLLGRLHAAGGGASERRWLLDRAAP